jgi:hypothetical protein
MTFKYEKLFQNPPPVLFKENGQIVYPTITGNQNQPIPNLVLNYHPITHPYVSKNSPHTHSYHEFLAWYGGKLQDSDDFGAEIVLYLGEELEKYVITRPTLVSLPPGFPHGPMEITRVDRPIFQVAMALKV